MEKLKSVPEGVTDVLAHDLAFKQNILDRVKLHFKKNGFQQVQTPIFEYYDLFTELKEPIEKKRMIKIVDTSGQILVLRPDATIPIARMVALHYNDVPGIKKFSYVTTIFRTADDPENVQSREITQAGVEWFGPNGVAADAEIIALAMDTLKTSGVHHFTMDIGQASFYKALIDEIEIGNEEKASLQKLIEMKNSAQLEQMVRDWDMDPSVKKALCQLPACCGEPELALKRAMDICVNDAMKMEIEYVKAVVARLADLGYGNNITLDFGMINQLNYYTGIVFQGYIGGYGKPVLLGGRYDHLTKYFGLDEKATGFAIYADDLVAAIKGSERGD